MPRGFTSPSECPVCGETVPRNARACPECGADERSGWDEDATRYDGLDLPSAAFTDEDQDFPVQTKRSSRLWTVVAIGLLVIIGLGLIFH